LATPYDQYNNLTLEEKKYIRLHPHHALAIKESKEEAFSQTKKKFGFNGRNDESDAFRHCYWSAILSRELGYYNARTFTSAHESSPQNIYHEKMMDLSNNYVGLIIGRSGGSNNILSQRCTMALKKNRLKTIK
jgi:hypothetical protein